MARARRVGSVVGPQGIPGVRGPQGVPGPAGSGAPGAPSLFAALATTTPPSLTHSQAIIDGYQSQSDGGQGSFYWVPSSTSTPDGGTVVAVTGISTGRWQRAYETLSAAHFGALGTGADDQPAIQAAIAAGVTNGSRRLKLPLPPSGVYSIASPIILSGDAGCSGFELFGESRAASLTGGATTQPIIRAITTAGSQFAPNTGAGATLTPYFQSGSGAQVTSVAGAVATMTGLTGLVAGAFGNINITSSSQAGNIGGWNILQVLSPTSCTIQGVGLAVDTGGDGWSTDSSTGRFANGYAVVLSGISTAALNKVAIGDSVVISNTATVGNADCCTVTSVQAGSGTCIITYDNHVDYTGAGHPFGGAVDAGLGGGVNWSFKKPLIKCYARDALITDVMLDGGGSAAKGVEITNDTGLLMTRPKLYKVGILNCYYGISIADSGTTAPPGGQGNCDYGTIDDVNFSSVVLPIICKSRSGQTKGWVLKDLYFGNCSVGIQWLSGSFRTENIFAFLVSGAVIVLSSPWDFIELVSSDCENCARFLTSAPYNNNANNIAVRGLRFDSNALAFDNSVILWNSPGGLLISNAECNANVNVTTHLVSLNPSPLNALGVLFPQVIIQSCTIGGTGPLVVTYPTTVGGVWQDAGGNQTNNGVGPIPTRPGVYYFATAGLSLPTAPIAITSGTVTPSPDNLRQEKHVYTGSLTGNVTLNYGSIGCGEWRALFGGVTLNGHTISVQNGTTTVVVSGLLSGAKTAIDIICTGPNALEVG